MTNYMPYSFILMQLLFRVIIYHFMKYETARTLQEYNIRFIFTTIFSTTCHGPF